MKIINYEKKEMMPFTNEEKESYKKQKVCYTCELIKNIKKSEIIVIIQKNIEELLVMIAIYVIKYQKRFL